MRPLLLFLIFSLCSCSITSYYIVRHAEKLNETTDPPLSEAGLARARILADTLRDKHIQLIYVSDRQRTAQTAEPTARLFSISPVVVPATETNKLIEELKAVNGKNVLVVRHSNELHLIVNALSPNDHIEPIQEEYHLMFLVKRRIFLWQRSYSLQRLIYGPEARKTMQ